MSLDFQRPLSPDRHPLTLLKYIVSTPSIDTTYTEVKRCLRHRVPGAMLLGQSRYGKTYAARWMSRMMKEDYPKIVTVTFGCERKKRPVESAFFENILEAAEHSDVYSGSNSAKRRRLINHLTDQVTRSGQNLVVFFIDEAQRLDLIEYEWLWDIHDQLERRGIRMITFLVGQQKLLNQKSALKEQGEIQIVNRLMVDELHFHGVRSAEEVASCLAGYDESCFPTDSDWTFTRFFLPYAYADGLRLADDAHVVWDAFVSAHESAGFRFKIDIPMAYFSRAVEIALTDCSEHDKSGFRLSPAIWEEVVRNSKYVAATEETRLRPDTDD